MLATPTCGAHGYGTASRIGFDRTKAATTTSSTIKSAEAVNATRSRHATISQRSRVRIARRSGVPFAFSARRRPIERRAYTSSCSPGDRGAKRLETRMHDILLFT